MSDSPGSLTYFIFVLSTTSTVFAVRASRTTSEHAYSTSLVLFLIDLGKLFVCLVAKSFSSEGNTKVSEFNTATAVPAVLYTWQTQLLLYSAKFVDPTTYQVLGQFKIVTTAFFARVLLRQRLSTGKYFSLALLFTGTVLIATSTDAEQPRLHAKAVGALVLSSLSSGFASTWTENCLKGRLFLDVNIELSATSAVLALFQFLLSQYTKPTLASCGTWCGFNKYVIIVIVLQIVSGFYIGIILKHADSVRKNFAVSVSLLLTCTIDIMYDARRLNTNVLWGITSVVSALLLYADVGITVVVFVSSCVLLLIDSASTVSG